MVIVFAFQLMLKGVIEKIVGLRNPRGSEKRINCRDEAIGIGENEPTDCISQVLAF